MEQGVTFLNEPHSVPLPYEINNTYVPKNMSINDYTSTLENTNHKSNCDNGHCNYTSNKPHYNKHTNMKNINNMKNMDNMAKNGNYNTDTVMDTYDPSRLMMSQCHNMYMHTKKCAYCKYEMNRKDYIFYLLILISILLFILLVITVLKKQ